MNAQFWRGMFAYKNDCKYAGWVRVLPPTGRDPHRPRLKAAAVDTWRQRNLGKQVRTTPLIEFTFRDAAGRWWLRDKDGVLSEIEENENYRYGNGAELAVS